MSDKALVDYVASNPRKMGVIFTMCLLLAQAGNVAGNVAAHSGP
ncbi:DUF7503 family protein [Halomicrococcus sp. SG-WS-1]